MIRAGEEWGGPAAGPPDLAVAGDDGALAAAIAGRPGVLVRCEPAPGADLARAVGLGTDPAASRAVPVDVLRADSGLSAVNMIVVGTPPDRLRRFSRRISAQVTLDGRAVAAGDDLTSVVIASGQFLRGHDVVPRGHPGDGRAEVQCYALPPGQRRAARLRLASGAHVPHPAIVQRSGVVTEVTVAGAPAPLEVDGRPAGSISRLSVRVQPGAFRLLL